MDIHDRCLQFYLQTDPVGATYLGMAEHADRLAAFSPGDTDLVLEQWRRFRDEVGHVHVAGLPHTLQVDHEAIAALIDEEIFSYETLRMQERDPGVYSDEIMQGISFVALRGRLTPEQRIEGLCGRLRESVRVVSEARANLRDVPAIWAEQARETLEDAEEYTSNLLSNLTAQLPPDRQTEYGSEIRGAQDAAHEAWELFRSMLADFESRPQTTSVGVGEAVFAEALWAMHRWRFPLRELDTISEKALQDTRAELESLSASRGFGTDWCKMLREASTRQPQIRDLLTAYRSCAGRARAFLVEKDLVPLPATDILDIIETPNFERPSTPTAAYYDPEAMVDQSHGTFMVTIPTASDPGLDEAMIEHSMGAIESTVVHEAYPGHQVQGAWAIASQSLLRRIMVVLSAAEGWALYGEELMRKAGFFSQDGLAFHLRDRLLRAARVRVDIGLQTNQMTIDEATQYLVTEVGLNADTARSEALWYSREPTVPLSYYIGMHQIHELKDACRRLRPGQFTESRFHQQFLEYGALPLPIITRDLLRRYGTTVDGGSV